MTQDPLTTGGVSTTIRVGGTMKQLAIMKCGDCGAIRHRIVPVDSIIECAVCGSENVIYPYNPK